ncbi:hypothetical protein [uncultured Clostridium sp.]|uniref:hypothetical protein n=1 Tax=uncultured Clostridium sp. TaxID=59620 RepID=UPI00261A7268|nr:hypothetical protein [uncultured Clostridium sp.]
MNSEGFWNNFKTLLSKTGYLKSEQVYTAYVSGYTYYLSHNEIETWDKFEEICVSKGYVPDVWVKYTFNTLLENRMDLDIGFSRIFGKALQENLISI